MKLPERNTVNTRKLALVLVILGTCFLLFLLVMKNGIGYYDLSPQKQILIVNSMTCKTSNGLESSQKVESIFTQDDWYQIGACLYVIPSGRSSLYATWVYEGESTIIFARSETEFVDSPGHIYFSLLEAIRYTEKLPYEKIHNFHDETLPNYPFPGKYKIVIWQLRDKLTELDFEITR